jgi:hypothetical protein
MMMLPHGVHLRCTGGYGSRIGMFIQSYRGGAREYRLG